MMRLNRRTGPRTAATIAFSLLVGCGSGCEEDENADPLTRAAGGSVARAADLTMRPRTEDGYEVIGATREMRSRAEAARAEETRDRENLVLEPTEPDPEGGDFTIDEAVEGLGTDGTLVAELSTSLGTFFCDLYTDKAPNTVANFIGLARGLRPWWDARHGQWRRFRYYDNTIFHRVIPDYLIQGGDYLRGGDGPVGYSIPDEPHDTLAHDRAGQLCMASTGVNENGAQFFITDGARPDLDADSQFTIFGQCRPIEMVERIARVPQGDDNRPRTDLFLNTIRIQRVRGGAANAQRTPPQQPEGFEPASGASPGPSELAIPGHPERLPNKGVFDPRNFRGMRPAPTPME
ncbi:MAG: peptidylprolyl isomerase [Myxococcota bacterium]